MSRARKFFILGVMIISFAGIMGMPSRAIAEDAVAMAPASAFRGLNLGIGVGYVQPQIDFNDSSGIYSYQKNALVPHIEVSYNFLLDDRWLIGTGASYDLEQTYAGRTDGHSGLAKASFKQHFSVFMKPTYALNADTAIYGKLAYHSTNINVKPVQGLNWITDLMRVHGYGVGAGVRHNLTSNVYLQLEGEWVDYFKNEERDGATKWEYDAQSINTNATIGFKF